VLVATSVIEVGIDVPNASVMLIEAAERYGLSQLHQLRGRVGRGPHPSLCILFGDPRLPRLVAIADESDGFRLAEVDLELRGAGEILGTRQHGLPEFRVARLPDDAALLERARACADQLVDADDPLLSEAVDARFGSELEPIPA
jgi:ATP-dependent DNA helicase RecG